MVELASLYLLPPATKHLLSSAGYISPTEVLLSPITTIAVRTRLSVEDATNLVQQVALAVDQQISPAVPLSDLLQLSFDSDPNPNPSHQSNSLSSSPPILMILDEEEEEPEASLLTAITTSDPILDSIFGLSPGIPLGSLTEVSGAASSGKSHFCLQLALTVQLPPSHGGVSGACCFISSEGQLPTGRLMDIAQGLLERGAEGYPEKGVDGWLDHVHTIKARDVEALEMVLEFHIPALIERLSSSERPIKLIAIDSIAAPFRGDPTSLGHSSTSFIARSKALSSISDKLKSLAYIHNVAVLVVNQVTDVFSSTQPCSPLAAQLHGLPQLLYAKYQSPNFSGERSGVKKAAALGYGWTNMINIRIMMSRDENGGGGRRMELIFSPFGQRESRKFALEKEGIRGVE